MLFVKISFVLFIVFYCRCYLIKLIIGQQQVVNGYTNNLQLLHQQEAREQQQQRKQFKEFSSFLSDRTNSGEANNQNSAANQFSQSLKLGHDIYTNEQLKNIDKYLYDDKLQQNYSIDHFLHISIASKFHAYTYNDLYVHRYDDYNQLKQSVDPRDVDQELCLGQLGALIERSERQSREEKFNSRDLSLYQLLDTFGRPAADQMQGNSLWLGSYNECLQLKLEANYPAAKDGVKETLPLRYCLASFQMNEWSKSSTNTKLFDDVIAIKAGVCLPKTCDSINYKNKYRLIHQLMEYNFREVDKGQAKLTKLYCLPDEESPLRDWKQSRRTVGAVCLLAAWFSLILYATVKARLSEGRNVKAAYVEPGERVGGKTAAAASTTTTATATRIYNSLSLVNNLRSLFSLRSGSQLLEEKSINLAAEGEEPMWLEQPIVDLKLLEGIKVISMCWIVMGHVLMCLTTVLENGREMGKTWSIPYHTSNMIPAFAVNSFFSITGLLTSYLMFKQNLKFKFLLQPTKWLAIFIHRYIRIMPLNLLAVLYAKTLAKYSSSGPLWDYATSSLSQRRICEQESWLLTLLFKANTKSPIEQCIPSAWYLANDFQFMLVTPIFLALLLKWPEFGKLFIKLSIVAGFLVGFGSIYNTELEDLTPIASFSPHGFKTYVTFLHSNYVRFQYRLPAYLIGLLIGFMLFNYELEMVKYLRVLKLKERLVEREKEALFEGQEKLDNCDKATDNKFNLSPKDLNSIRVRRPEHSKFLVQNITKYSLFFVIFCSLTPLMATLVPFNRWFARLLVSLIMPTYHILFSLAVGLYILLASTGHGNERLNRFLAAPAWKPFARMSLCVVLINVEVINYILQSSTRMWHIDASVHICLNLLCLAAIYLCSTLVYVLFEAPLKSVLGIMFERLLNRMKSKNKAD